MVQLITNLPTMQETGIQSLGWEDPLEKEMATLSSTLGEFHGQSSQVGYSSWDPQEWDRTVQLTFTFPNIRSSLRGGQCTCMCEG